jgi:hypothetical protein
MVLMVLTILLVGGWRLLVFEAIIFAALPSFWWILLLRT